MHGPSNLATPLVVTAVVCFVDFSLFLTNFRANYSVYCLKICGKLVTNCLLLP